jgi:hypothetical protein
VAWMLAQAALEPRSRAGRRTRGGSPPSGGFTRAALRSRPRRGPPACCGR